MDYLKRITIDPAIRNGKSCVKHARIITLFRLAAAVGIQFCVRGAEPRNLLVNGSLESPVTQSNYLEQASPTSWDTGGTILFLNGNLNGTPWAGRYPQASDGQQSLMLTIVPGQSFLSQSVTVTNTERYTLRWEDAAPTYPGAASPAPYSATVLDETSMPVATKTVGPFRVLGWNRQALSMTLTPGTYTVRFRTEWPRPEVNHDAENILLDNLALVEFEDDLQSEIRLSSVDVRWRGLTNQMYQVQYTTSLRSNIWLNLGPAILGNGTNVLTDPITDTELRFYRVTRVP